MHTHEPRKHAKRVKHAKHMSKQARHFVDSIFHHPLIYTTCFVMTFYLAQLLWLQFLQHININKLDEYSSQTLVQIK